MMEEIEIDPNDFLWFGTEVVAIDVEGKISQKMELPSERGDRWDVPKLREFDGEMKWSVIKPKE